MKLIPFALLFVLALLASGCIYGKFPPFTEKDVADCIQKDDLDHCIAKCSQIYFPSGVLFNNCYYWTVNQTILKYGIDNQSAISKVRPLCEEMTEGISPTKENCYDLLA